MLLSFAYENTYENIITLICQKRNRELYKFSLLFYYNFFFIFVEFCDRIVGYCKNESTNVFGEIFMTNQNTRENPLGYEKISKLLRSFALPSIVAMLVSSLYNIVDQMFIGNYVGKLGNAATTVAFPLTTICIAISVLAGVGGASRFSIELGKGDKEEAGKCIGNALTFAAILSIAYSVLAFVFSEQLLTLFGGSGETLRLAMEYSNFIIPAMPFLIISNVMSNFIRADGSPKFSMVCMVVGAVINIGLDALFVCDWGFDWGMSGAAAATAISQLISCVIALTYLRRFSAVKIGKSTFELQPRKMLNIASLGMSNCVNQLAICLVQIVMNAQLTTYAMKELAQADWDTPLAAFGVVMKVNSIIISVFVGMAQGMQPIAGFNYGAKRFDRVKRVCLIASGFCGAIATVGIICFQIFPEYIVGMFGAGDVFYEEFAVKTIRIFLLMVPATGVQMTISNFFSAIGKPTRGVILSLTRQVLLIVPLLLIIPLFLGLDGVLYAAPITDFLAFLLAVVFAIFEFKRPEYKNR